jgi:hypothetical protein
MIKLTEATIEDQTAFKIGLEKLLNELSINLVVNIVKVPVGIKMEDGSIKNVFADEPSFLLQKKVAISDTSEPEAPKVTDVKAEPTISPFVPQAPTDETPN